MYTLYSWDFGDGDHGTGARVQYTFRDPGNYTVTLNVTDTAGNWGVTSTVVRLVAGPGTTDSWPGLLVLILAIAGTAALAAVMVVEWRRHRAARTLAAPPPWARTSDSSGRAALASLAPSASPESPSDTPRGGEARRSRTPVVSAETLRTSQKVLLHLYRQGRLTADDLAGIERTQLGLGRLLQAGQGAVSNVLRRLTAGGLITSQVEHVEGHPRRLRVYVLTPRGERLARQLWARATAMPSSENAPAREPPVRAS